MLVLDIQEMVNGEKKRGLRKAKRTVNEFERLNFKCGDKLHTVVTVPENMIGNQDFFKLLKAFKGQVIACDDTRINDLVEPYRFDSKPYFKEAVYSSLYNWVLGDKGIKTVCVKDSNFKISPKLTELVKVCRNLVIEAPLSIEIQRFSDEIFMNYGAFIKNVEYYTSKETGVYLDTQTIDVEGKGRVLINGKESIIYPDPSYFFCNECVKELLKYKIPIKQLCAAFNEI